MKRVWTWFRSLSRFGQIGVASLAAHAALILALLINHVATLRPPLRKPIRVRTTVAASAPLPAVKKAPLSPPIRPPKEAKLAPLPKTTSQKRGQEKRGKERKESPQAASIDPTLLQQIADSLDTIGASPKKASPSFTPRLPPSVVIQSEGAAEDRPGYGETVSAILQSTLDLPEFGEVVARIEIDAKGAVTQCVILHAKSRKNGEFLKKRLRELVFPCFNEFGLSENCINFTITFHNAENR